MNKEFIGQCLIEIRFNLWGDTDCFYFLLVDKKLSYEEQKELEEELIHEWMSRKEDDVAVIIHDVMKKKNLNWTSIPYARLIKLPKRKE